MDSVHLPWYLCFLLELIAAATTTTTTAAVVALYDTGEVVYKRKMENMP